MGEGGRASEGEWERERETYFAHKINLNIVYLPE